MNDAPKKRLAMLPEILPTPRRENGAGDVRARTIAHMNRLLAAAAAAGSLGACAKEPQPTVAPTDTGPGPVAMNAHDASAPIATTEETARPKPTATVSEPTQPTGYAVVDPVPPPAVCPNAAAQVPAAARWKQSGGHLVVEIALLKSNGPDAITYPRPNPTAYGGKVTATSGTADTQRLEILPDPGNTSVSLSLGVMCNGRPMHFSIGLDTSKPPRPGMGVPVTLSAY